MDPTAVSLSNFISPAVILHPTLVRRVGKTLGTAKNLTHRSRYRFLSYLLTSSQVFRIPVRMDLLNLVFSWILVHLTSAPRIRTFD